MGTYGSYSFFVKSGLESMCKDRGRGIPFAALPTRLKMSRNKGAKVYSIGVNTLSKRVLYCFASYSGCGGHHRD